jgi:hypothetical protein
VNTHQGALISEETANGSRLFLIGIFAITIVNPLNVIGLTEQPKNENYDNINPLFIFLCQIGHTVKLVYNHLQLPRDPKLLANVDR